MAMLVEPLALDAPLAGFNGGLVVEPDMEVLEEHAIADELVAPAIRLLEASGLYVWAYRGNDWYVRDPDGPRVDRESHTLQFEPTVIDDFDALGPGVAKLVGVSDDLDAVATAQRGITDELGEHVSAATSQPYYLDVTHPRANKGAVVAFLSSRYEIPPEDIATIGDGRNDVLMFDRSGISIAMGNATEDVQQAARHVTTTNEEDGFANAVERFILARKELKMATDTPMQLGMVGLGRMGAGIVRRLLKDGHHCVGYDVFRRRREGARGGRRDSAPRRSRSSQRSSRSRARLGDGPRGRHHGQDDRRARRGARGRRRRSSTAATRTTSRTSATPTLSARRASTTSTSARAAASGASSAASA